MWLPLPQGRFQVAPKVKPHHWLQSRRSACFLDGVKTSPPALSMAGLAPG